MCMCMCMCMCIHACPASLPLSLTSFTSKHLNTSPLIPWTPKYSITYSYDEARSICDGVGGHLVEIQTRAELDYLTKISARFWLGAQRNQTSGLWYWDTTGEQINVDIFRSYRVDCESIATLYCYCISFQFKSNVILYDWNMGWAKVEYPSL